jgi:branched-chain amino acid transport system substrate-binding protein
MKRFIYPAATAALLLSSLLVARVSAQSVHSRANASPITIQLCVSAPYGVPTLKDVVQDMRNSVAAAIYHWRPVLAEVGVKIGPQINLDDAKADGSTYDPDIEAANGLKCINNKNVLGYVGALNSGASVRSEPETNKAHLVQISPANTNPGLTSYLAYNGFGGRAAQEPATFNHRVKWVTYYRTITTDALQGPAGAVFAKNYLHAGSVYVIDDSLPYGVGLSNAFQQEAAKRGMSIKGHGEVPGSPDATKQKEVADAAAKANADMVYCGCDTETTVVLARDLRLGGYTKPLMGGDIFVSAAYLTAIAQGASVAATANDYGTLPGVPPTAVSKAFQALYQKLFPSFTKKPGPGPYHGTSYDAAGVILTAIYDAAKAHQLKPGATLANRTAIVRHVRYIKYCGATGCFKFDNNGDTNNYLIQLYKAVNGAWVYVTVGKAPTGYKPAP